MNYDYLMNLFNIFYSFSWGEFTLGFLTTALFSVLTTMIIFLVPKIISNRF